MIGGRSDDSRDINHQRWIAILVLGRNMAQSGTYSGQETGTTRGDVFWARNGAQNSGPDSGPQYGPKWHGPDGRDRAMWSQIGGPFFGP